MRLNVLYTNIRSCIERSAHHRECGDDLSSARSAVRLARRARYAIFSAAPISTAHDHRRHSETR
ncbi:hypothetical protein C6Q22_15415 [Burkholderia multivorans]|nr:hypothetical protein C6Q22_15415 [Burkholderia multivorans]